MSTRLSPLAQSLLLVLLPLLIGITILPAAVFVVGSKLFGAYAGNGAGLVVFYQNFVRDLASVKPAAWVLAVGPLLLIWLLRLIFRSGAPRTPREDAEKPTRVEPSIRS